MDIPNIQVTTAQQDNTSHELAKRAFLGADKYYYILWNQIYHSWDVVSLKYQTINEKYPGLELANEARSQQQEYDEKIHKLRTRLLGPNLTSVDQAINYRFLMSICYQMILLLGSQVSLITAIVRNV